MCIFATENTTGPGRFPENIKHKDMELKYTSKEINHNYKIKVSGIHEGKKINTLVGVRGLVAIVGDTELTNRKELKEPYRVEFWDGPMNGARRYYKTLRGAKVAAKNYIRSANKNWSDCRAYAEIHYLDTDFRATKLMTIE